MYSEYHHCQCGYDGSSTTGDCFCDLSPTLKNEIEVNDNIITVIADEVIVNRTNDSDDYNDIISNRYRPNGNHEANFQFDKDVKKNFENLANNTKAKNIDDYFNFQNLENEINDLYPSSNMKALINTNTDNEVEWKIKTDNKFNKLIDKNIYKESDLTRQLKIEIQSFEKRNVDLIIEVERLRLELKQHKKKYSNEIEILEKEIKISKVELNTFKNENTVQKQQTQQLQNETVILKKHISEMNIVNKKLETDLNKVQIEKNVIEKSLEQMKNEKIITERDACDKSQILVEKEMVICRLQSECNIVTEKLKFIENVNSDLTQNLKNNKVNYEQMKQEWSDTVNNLNKQLLESKMSFESLREKYEQAIKNNEESLAIMKSHDNENVILQDKLETLIVAEKKLMESIEELKSKEKVAKCELNNLRSKLAVIETNFKNKENDCKKVNDKYENLIFQNENLMKDNKLLKIKQDELIENNKKFEKVTQRLEADQISCQVNCESMKSENYRLKQELNFSLKKCDDLHDQLTKYEEMKLRDQKHIVDLETSVSLLQDKLSQENKAKHKLTRWANLNKKSSNFSSDRCQTCVSKFEASEEISRELEKNRYDKMEDRHKIYNLLDSLSIPCEKCLWNSKEVSHTSNFETNENEILKKIFDSRRQEVLQKLNCFEKIQKTIKINYNDKMEMFIEHEKFLKQEIYHLEQALMKSRKSELNLQCLLDSLKRSHPNISHVLSTAYLSQTATCNFFLAENILKLESQERLLIRQIAELQMIKNNLQGTLTKPLNNSLFSHNGLQNLENVVERDILQNSNMTTHGYNKSKTKNVDIAGADVCQLMILDMKNKHLQFKEQNLFAQISKAERNYKELNDKLAEDQELIINIKAKNRHLEMLHGSLRHQLELSNEREQKLANRINVLNKELISLETTLEETNAVKESMTSNLADLQKSFSDLKLQLTHAYDELNDKAYEISNFQNKITKYNTEMEKLKIELNTCKLVEEKLKYNLEVAMKNENELTTKIENKKKKNKVLKSEISQNKKDYSELEKNISNLNEKVFILEKENEKLKTNLETSNENQAQTEKHLEGIKKLFEHHKTEFHEKLQNKKSEIDELRKINSEMRHEVIGLERKCESLKNTLALISGENKALQINVAETQKELTTFKCKLVESDANLMKSKKMEEVTSLELKQKEEKIELIRHDKQVLNDEIADWKMQYKNLQDECKDAKIENENLKKEIKTLKCQIENEISEHQQNQEQWSNRAEILTKHENELIKRLDDVEKQIQNDSFKKLENLSFNSKGIQVDMTIKHLLSRLAQDEIIHIIDYHNDFKRARNLLSVKYPNMHHNFMSDLKAFLMSNRSDDDGYSKQQINLSEPKHDVWKMSENNEKELYLNDSIFLKVPENVKSNPIYGKRIENNEATAENDEPTTDIDLSDAQLSPPRNKSPIMFSQPKLFPIGFTPALRNNSKQFGHSFWHSPVTNLDNIPDARKRKVNRMSNNNEHNNGKNNETKNKIRSKKKATYSEEMTTYVRSRPLSTPLAPKFKISYLPSFDDNDDEKNTKDIKRINDSGNKQNIANSKHVIDSKTLKDTVIDDENESENSNRNNYKASDNEPDQEDSETDSIGNIVQKRIAMFEQKAK